MRNFFLFAAFAYFVVAESVRPQRSVAEVFEQHNIWGKIENNLKDTPVDELQKQIPADSQIQAKDLDLDGNGIATSQEMTDWAFAQSHNTSFGSYAKPKKIRELRKYAVDVRRKNCKTGNRKAKQQCKALQQVSLVKRNFFQKYIAKPLEIIVRIVLIVVAVVVAAVAAVVIGLIVFLIWLVGQILSS